ncbi:anhydro-N-acetylmuramic acid kinase [Gracilimonas mengyeensis]|uniref:Anhydro-N-acetylmuramic acid kinase n=1 Tax=Gracilimonas mengyeensis TaxID=1302730 RepID=A0A521BC13_9BACT|nr:anhydro-N-acetylmuramic acid kinase [Gracilimonas mengyeensis]SMO44665.1 anhydro-N-acetylmuramic acid kinase [Gracilimonas mengyeensis]
MNKYLSKLWEISRKPERLIIGLMSGTALDGLDIALCALKGSGRDTKIDIREFTTQPYPDDFKKRLYSVQSKETTNTRQLTLLHSEMGNLFGDLVLRSLKEWKLKPNDIDLVASHGQTVYHAPAEVEGEVHATLQMVDADHIAQKTGIITVADFRQKHTAVGGEGAPLAGIFDDIFFRDEKYHRMLLNLGGIANFSWLPCRECNQQGFATDTGPANTLINEAMIRYFDEPFDESGKIAEKGKVHSELVRYVLLEPYFRKAFPKTTGQEDFQLSYIEELMKGHRIELSPEDLVASLTAITSQSIARAVDEVIGDQPFECYVSGGGIHNQTMMQNLKERIPQAEFKSFDDLGLQPDAKEAAMMAFFANELVVGEGFIVPGITEEKIHLGKISLPG